MTTKTITVTKDAYESMHCLKGEGESFSDLFIRLGSKKCTAKDVLGALHDTPEQIVAWKTAIQQTRTNAIDGNDARLHHVRTRLKRTH